MLYINVRATTPWLALPLLAQFLLRNRGNDNHNGLTHLKKARLDKGYTVAEVCRLTGLSYDNYIKYEREEVKAQYMCLDTLRRLSDVLGVDCMTDYHRFKDNAAEIVRQYMDTHNLSIRRFAEVADVSATTIKQWRNGTCSPSYELWERFFRKK